MLKLQEKLSMYLCKTSLVVQRFPSLEDSRWVGDTSLDECRWCAEDVQLHARRRRRQHGMLHGVLPVCMKTQQHLWFELLNACTSRQWQVLWLERLVHLQKGTCHLVSVRWILQPQHILPYSVSPRASK